LQAIAAANARSLGLIGANDSDYAVNRLRVYDIQKAIIAEEKQLWDEKLRYLQTEQQLQRQLLQLQLERQKIELEQQRIDLERSRDEAVAKGDREGVEYANRRLDLLARMEAVTSAITAAQLAAQDQRAAAEQKRMERERLDSYSNIVTETARNPFLRRGEVQRLLMDAQPIAPTPTRDRDRNTADITSLVQQLLRAQPQSDTVRTPDALLAALKQLLNPPAPNTRSPMPSEWPRAGDVIITINNTFSRVTESEPQIEQQVARVLSRVVNATRAAVGR
jgi:hypothetical protein